MFGQQAYRHLGGWSMRCSLFVGVCLTCSFALLGPAVQAQPEPRVPTDQEVMRAIRLPPAALEKGVFIVKERTARGLWKCTVHYSNPEPVRLPWGGWVPVPAPRSRVVYLDLGGPKA
jgi:hypothetical protein